MNITDFIVIFKKARITTNLLSFLIGGLFSFSVYAQTSHIVDFEVANNGYTATGAYGSGHSDFFNRTNYDLDNTTNEDGYFWGAEDMNVGNRELNIDQIDVTGALTFTFSIDMLTRGSADWDADDELIISYSIDGGSYQNLLWVQSVSSTDDNRPAAIDTDFNGDGECGVGNILPAMFGSGAGGCTVAASNFETFTATVAIPYNSSTLDVNLKFNGLTRGNEGLYIDNIIVEHDGGNSLPPPDVFSLVPNSDSQIDVTYDDNTNGDTVVIVFNTTGNFHNPASSPPAIGGTIAGGEIIVKNIGSATFNHTSLLPNTTYHYVAYSWNGSEYSNPIVISENTDPPVYSSFPYLDDFEMINNDWLSTSNNTTSWERGTPSGTILNVAKSGSNVYGTDLDDSYMANTQVELRSAIFNNTGNASNLQVSFFHWINSESSNDGLRFQYSLNGGSTWNDLNTGFAGWHNNVIDLQWDGTSASGYAKALAEVPGSANNSSVQFQFIFESNALNEEEGVLIDDFEVSRLVVEPVSGFVASVKGMSQIDLTWTLNGSGDDVVLARNTTNSFGALVSGNSYSVGDVIGTAEVVYVGNGLSYSETCLDGDQEYFYEIYSTNSSSVYSSGLNGYGTTQTKQFISGGGGAFSDLIISEYVEGSGNNEYLEIYNGTGTTIDLSGYSIKRYLNGNTSGSSSSLSGTLADGQVVVLRHNHASIYGGTTTQSNGCYFNGNDVLELLNGSTVIDAIGIIGDATNFAQDVTLVRKASICGGNGSYDSGEWDSYSQNTVAYLGSHSTTCSTSELAQSYTTSAGSWSTTGNWLDGQIPLSEDDVAIKNNVTIDGNYTCDTIVINEGATLIISAGNTLTVDGILVNRGIVIVQDEASIVQTSIVNANCGSDFQVTRNSGTLSNDTWYQYWSSPVSGETMGDVFTGSNTNDFYSFDGSWTSEGSGTTMTPGAGYATTGTIGITGSSENRTFSGSINNGNVTVNSSVSAAGFTLVGNPYPSALSAAKFLTDNSGQIEGTLWFWDHHTNESGGNNDAGDYATWNGSGGAGNSGDAPNGNIGTAQGFFVQAATGSPDVEFNNAQRISGNNDKFYKTNNTEQRKRAWFTLTNENNDVNQILVAFLPQATDGYDDFYDGKKFKAHPRLAFYSMINDEEFAIQGLPWLGLNKSKEIPLGVDAWVTGNMTIALDSLANWPTNYSITLEDRLMGTTVSLEDASDYSFTIDSVGTIQDRFYLHVSNVINGGGSIENPSDKGSEEEDNPTGVEELQENQLVVFRSGEELVISSDLSQLDQITVFDVSGRVVYDKTLTSNMVRIPWNSNGVFIVSITTVDGEKHNSKVNFY